MGEYNFYGYIDFDGRETIPFIFNKVGNFNERGEADVNFLGKEITISTSGYYQEGKDGCYYRTSWNGDLQGLSGIFSENMPYYKSDNKEMDSRRDQITRLLL